MCQFWYASVLWLCYFSSLLELHISVLSSAMQTLNSSLQAVPKDRNGKISKEYLRVILDAVAPSAGLPPVGAVEQVSIHYTDFKHNLIVDISEMISPFHCVKLNSKNMIF